MKKIVMLFLVMTSLINCQEKVTQDNLIRENTNIELIKKHMKLQQKIELSENDRDTLHMYRLTDIDIELGGEIVSEGMKNSGYKTPNSEVFTKRVKEIFKGSPNYLFTTSTNHDNFITFFLNPDKEKDIKKTEYDYTYDHIFVLPKYGVITTLPLLNDLATIKGSSLSINLDQNVIARNKYLFNDSKSDLMWLLTNDKEFLKSLLVCFGYDKEDKINEFVLNEFYKEYSSQTPSSLENIGNLFFVKDNSGKMKIRKNLLNYVEKTTTQDNDKFISALSQYIVSILYSSANVTQFSEDEKAEIVAYISSIEIPAFNKYKGESDVAWSNQASSLFYLQSGSAMNHPEVLNILKKHNYYGFSYLKDYIESGKLEDENPTSPQGDE